MTMATASAFDSEPDFVDTPTNDIVPSISFSGCGFLGVYHIGVATCLREHTDVLNRPEIRFAGASAGALVATTMLCGVDFGAMTKLLLEVAEVIRDGVDVLLTDLLKEVMKKYLPDDAYIRLSNRLYISITLVTGFENGLITEFKSNDHLIECLVASSFVPGFTGRMFPSLSPENMVTSNKGHPPCLGKKKEKCDSVEDEDGDCLPRPEKEMLKVEPDERKESVWDVYLEDNSNASTSKSNETPTNETTPTKVITPTKVAKRKLPKKRKSYLKWLVDLCFLSLKTTSKVVRQVPLASRVINSVVPRHINLNGFEEFLEAIVMELMGEKYLSLDGGFSDNIPCFDSNTITVSPFSGESDICPSDMTDFDFNFHLGKTSMQFSEDNVFRLCHALNPMDPSMLLKLCEEGYDACLRFLHRKDLLGCKKHLMTRAILSSSPCNIGHAHCACSTCQASEAKIKSSLSCVNCQRAKQKALSSNLPAEVQLEFKRAIDDFSKRPQPSTNINRFATTIWWIVERMCSGTLQLADLAINFSNWIMRFFDNVPYFVKYATLPYGHKRHFVRCILSSLKTSLSAPRNSKSQVSCSLNKIQPMCS